jgi:hypothetical protein
MKGLRNYKNDECTFEILYLILLYSNIEKEKT